ncbi:MAG TPA: L,D-transpeptidase family protein, partial [Longimicrobiales bacterium]|nr:L,D-transpeptidase family protein [Longimicrobiales bacterium]
AVGGWPVVPAGPTLRLGDEDERVPVLRERLVMGGDLDPEDVVTGNRFDEALDAAVRRFQHRHALNEDGAVGRATLAELNVPVEARIDQVRINLERARWFTHDLPQSFVAANIAGAKVYMVRDGDVIFETRAVVGTTYRSTPIFTDQMRYLELNPTWTVPPGIVGDILNNIRRDPNYLRTMNMRVLDRSGRPVDPATIDFSQYTARTFPYVFRQEPGPLNALGRIKFMFPNQYNVYLHDTPSRELFAREDRNFSSGCIRVEDPIRLAELILDEPVRWSREAIEAAIATGQTRTIPLATPFPVLILYWTASADLHGEVHYYRDAYQRDASLLAALNRAM